MTEKYGRDDAGYGFHGARSIPPSRLLLKQAQPPRLDRVAPDEIAQAKTEEP